MTPSKKSAASRSNGKLGGRPRSAAREALERLKTCPPEQRAQAYEEWLRLATAAQVRQDWRAWMGPMPGRSRADA